MSPVRFARPWILALTGLMVPVVQADEHGHHHQPQASAAETRTLVKFPPELKRHTLANMRDHLNVLSDIQGLLARQDYEKAAELAERHLGMSSLSSHGAHEVAKYMPEGMKAAGSAMHRSASRFALTAQEAAVDHDLGRALGALHEVTRNCVACHAQFGFE